VHNPEAAFGAQAVARRPYLSSGEPNNDPKSDILVSTNDLESLLHEFFRLDTILKQKFPNTPIANPEEDHRVT